MAEYTISKIELPNGDICNISTTWENIKLKPTISSPSPNGTSISFIDTITQTHGTISATKKTVPNATTSENGLMLSSDKEKLDDIDLIKQVKTINIEPVQAGSGDPSPDNVRPITGWTGATVQRTGKNVLSLPIYYRSNLTVPELFFIKAGTYILHYTVSGATSWRVGVWMRDRDGNNLSDNVYKPYQYFSWYTSPGYWMDGGNGVRTSISITIVEDCYVRFFFGLGDTTSSTVFSDQMLELGSTATSYEPYTGTTFPVTFPASAGTVYGGYVDLVEGKLVVNRAEVDLGTLTWETTTLASQFRSRGISTLVNRSQGNYGVAAVFCSRYVATSFYDQNSGSAGVAINNNGYVHILDSAYADAAVFKAAMSGVQLVYELAAPITYDIDPTQILLLAEHKHVWTDCGDIILQSCFTNNAANVTGIVAVEHGGTGATVAATALSNLGGVAKSGDTMTGNLNIIGKEVHVRKQSTAMDMGTNPSANTYNYGLIMTDANNLPVTQIDAAQLTNGQTSLRLLVYDYDTSKTSKVTGGIYIYGSRDGKVSYYLSNPENFRDALGLGNTSGALPVANGGTGISSFTANSVIMSGNSTTAALTTRAITNNTSATAVTASTNLITANTLYYHKGNSNITTVGTISSGTWQGTAIAASYIGNHSTDKLTSGTLPVERGGTGQTSIANIQAGKDGDGNTISSTYLKLSGGNMTGELYIKKDNGGISICNTSGTEHARIYSSSTEGGNIRILSPGGIHRYEWDAQGNTTIRIVHSTTDNSITAHSIISLSNTGSLNLTTPLAITSGGTGVNSAAISITNQYSTLLAAINAQKGRIFPLSISKSGSTAVTDLPSSFDGGNNSGEFTAICIGDSTRCAVLLFHYPDINVMYYRGFYNGAWQTSSWKKSTTFTTA